MQPIVPSHVTPHDAKASPLATIAHAIGWVIDKIIHIVKAVFTAIHNFFNPVFKSQEIIELKELRAKDWGHILNEKAAYDRLHQNLNLFFSHVKEVVLEKDHETLVKEIQTIWQLGIDKFNQLSLPEVASMMLSSFLFPRSDIGSSSTPLQLENERKLAIETTNLLLGAAQPIEQTPPTPSSSSWGSYLYSLYEKAKHSIVKPDKIEAPSCRVSKDLEPILEKHLPPAKQEYWKNNLLPLDEQKLRRLKEDLGTNEKESLEKARLFLADLFAYVMKQQIPRAIDASSEPLATPTLLASKDTDEILKALIESVQSSILERFHLIVENLPHFWLDSIMLEASRHLDALKVAYIQEERFATFGARLDNTAFGEVSRCLPDALPQEIEEIRAFTQDPKERARIAREAFIETRAAHAAVKSDKAKVQYFNGQLDEMVKLLLTDRQVDAILHDFFAKMQGNEFFVVLSKMKDFIPMFVKPIVRSVLHNYTQTIIRSVQSKLSINTVHGLLSKELLPILNLNLHQAFMLQQFAHHQESIARAIASGEIWQDKLLVNYASYCKEKQIPLSETEVKALRHTLDDIDDRLSEFFLKKFNQHPPTSKEVAEALRCWLETPPKFTETDRDKSNLYGNIVLKILDRFTPPNAFVPTLTSWLKGWIGKTVLKSIEDFRFTNARLINAINDGIEQSCDSKEKVAAIIHPKPMTPEEEVLAQEEDDIKFSQGLDELSRLVYQTIIFQTDSKPLNFISTPLLKLFVGQDEEWIREGVQELLRQVFLKDTLMNESMVYHALDIVLLNLRQAAQAVTDTPPSTPAPVSAVSTPQIQEKPLQRGLLI